MGTLLTTSIMIKVLLGSALLALTAAEADPQLLYGAGLPYAAGVPYVGTAVGAVAHAPVVKSVVDTPAEVEHEVTAHPVAIGYHGLGYHGLGYTYGKRSAEAEPEADAYYGYYGYGGYRGYYGHPYRYGGYRYYGKRSADAEPAVLDGASRVISAPTPLIHNPPVLPHVAYAAHPLAYAGYAAGLPLAGHLPYAGLPYAGPPLVAAPVAAPEGAVVAERKKREADPQILLNGALPYAGLPYAAAPATFATVGAVAHVPVVRNVEVSPAEVSHEVTAHAVPAVAYHGLGYGYPYAG